MLTNTKKLFVISLLLIIAWIFISTFVVDSLKQENAGLRTKLENDRAKVGSIIGRAGGIDNTILNKTIEEQKRISDKIVKMKEKTLFQPRPEYTVDSTQPDLLIKFTTLRGAQYSRLKKLATNKGIKLPAPTSFGFPTDAIPAGSLPPYFEKLDVIDRIISLAIEKDCQEITSVAIEKGVSDFLDINLLANDFFQTDVLLIKLKASFKSATEIICALNENIARGEGFLAIPRISLESSDPDADLLTMTLAVGLIKKTSGNQGGQ